MNLRIEIKRELASFLVANVVVMIGLVTVARSVLL